jgi:hypothetical protein
MRRLVPLFVSFSVATSLVACGSHTPTAPPAAGACGYDALVAVSDYTSSGVGGFTVEGAGYLSYGGLGADPALSASNGRAFFVQRDVGQIVELDPSCGTPLDGGVVSANGGTTRTTNPQDVAAAPDRSLWVPRYDDPSVIQIASDGGIARTVSLGSTSYDPDGNPNASAIAILPVNGVSKAFVALEVLDDAALPYPAPYPTHPSLVLRIDVASGTIDGTTSLVGRNPFGLFVPYGGALWLAEPGTFDQANESSAGVERFDPQTQTSTLVVAETAFGASVAEVAVTSGCAAAVVADATTVNATSLVTFDPDTGAALTTAAKPVLATSGYDLQGMLWVGNVLLVGDRTPATGGAQRYPVHAFDRTPGDCVLTERPDAIFLEGLPPVGFQPTP